MRNQYKNDSAALEAAQTELTKAYEDVARTTIIAMELALYEQFGAAIQKGNVEAFQNYREAMSGLALSVTTRHGVLSVAEAYTKAANGIREAV